MPNYKMMTEKMWDHINTKTEEFALSLLPTSLCPACDCLELYEHTVKCPNCGYPNRFMSQRRRELLIQIETFAIKNKFCRSHNRQFRDRAVKGLRKRVGGGLVRFELDWDYVSPSDQGKLVQKTVHFLPSKISPKFVQFEEGCFGNINSFPIPDFQMPRWFYLSYPDLPRKESLALKASQ